jgi:superfamily II DNA or RNA helicase
MADAGNRSGWQIDIGRIIEQALRVAVQGVDVVRGLREGPYQLVVRLSLEDGGRGGGRLDHLLQAVDDPSLIITPSVPDAWWRPVMFATRTGTEMMSVARRVQRAGRAFPPMARSTRTSDPLRTDLSSDEVGDFLRDGAVRLRRQGCVVQVPAELTPDGRARLRARLHVGASGDHQLPSWGLGDAATEPFRWELTLGDVEITPEEFVELAKMKRSVVQVRGTWIAVDAGELAEAARALGDLTPGSMPAAQAAGLALAGDLPVTKATTATIVATGRVQASLVAARDLETARDLPQPASFVGMLRPYQRRGLAWMTHLESASLGGCLADDMGLGKTAQVIALVLARVEAGVDRGATLVVCPASVLPNWERELMRFAPSLDVVRHHGSVRARRAETLARQARVGTVVLTTYATLRSSQKVLSSITWERVVLDEAQNIKNPSAAQSKAARQLDARHRFALTGTPVENRLDDLWSIMQFANPGLLGPRASFRERFAAPVERGDLDAAERLRRLTRPFLLRRLKSDPAVVGDLPPKVEVPVSCSLTLEQATLYQAAVDQAVADLEPLDGMRRRARILVLLTELKQICDHPALYLHERGPLGGRSGKLDRLTEMIDEAVSEDDAVLVFTQYAEMGRLLVSHLADALDLDVPFLHGRVPIGDRQELVDLFQNRAGPPVMVASLRAAGVGINLTRATHVVHYDRWWNPAVEDQATDRTHRIGQTSTVFVHRLLVAGTLEERVDELIDRKRSRAGSVVEARGWWGTELPNDELAELIRLR